MKLKTAAAVLIAAILFSAFAFSPKAEAAKKISLSDADIKQRLDTLFSLVGNKYFNTTQSTSCGKKSHDHGCRYCLTNNIVEADWFIDLFGNITISQFPTTYTYSGYFGGAAYSCAGFAAFAEWYIFKENTRDKVETERIGRYMFTSENMNSKAQIGDLIRLNGVGHSFIIYEIESDGVEIIDCNWGGDYNCLVRKHKLVYDKYSDNSFTISRVPHTSVSALSVSYNAGGGKIDSAVTGTKYRVTAPTGLNFRKAPDLDSDIISELPCGTVFDTSAADDPVEADGYTWVKSVIDGKTGWLAVSKDTLAVPIGESRNSEYYLDENGVIRASSDGETYRQIIDYGETLTAGLPDAEHFGMYCDEMVFKGWICDGMEGVIAAGEPVKAEDIADKAAETKQITLYAVWEKVVVYGDCNGDGEIDAKDIVHLRKYLDRFDVESGTSGEKVGEGADCNGDGVTDAKDLIRLRKYLAEYDEENQTSPVVLGPEN